MTNHRVRNTEHTSSFQAVATGLYAHTTVIIAKEDEDGYEVWDEFLPIVGYYVATPYYEGGEPDVTPAVWTEDMGVCSIDQLSSTQTVVVGVVPVAGQVSGYEKTNRPATEEEAAEYRKREEYEELRSAENLRRYKAGLPQI